MKLKMASGSDVVTQKYVDHVMHGVTYHASEPPSPVTGDIYFDQVTQISYIFDGTRWLQYSSNEAAPIRKLAKHCHYCGRPWAFNKGDHSCDGCGAGLELEEDQPKPTPKKVAHYNNPFELMGPAGVTGCSGPIGPKGWCGTESGGPQ